MSTWSLTGVDMTTVQHRAADGYLWDLMSSPRAALLSVHPAKLQVDCSADPKPRCRHGKPCLLIKVDVE